MTTITIDIIAQHFYDFVTTPGVQGIYTVYDFADIGLRNYVNVATYQGIIGFPANHATGVFIDPADMAAYYYTGACATLISEINSFQSVYTYVAGNMIITDESTQMVINTKQNQHPNLSSLSSGTFVSGDIARMISGAITGVSMSDFVAGLMASANSAALVSGMGLGTAAYAATTDFVPVSRTVNGHTLSSNVTVTAADVGAPSGSGTSTGTNTGDQNLSGLATTSALTAGLAGKQNSLTTGTSSQYFKGDLSLGTFTTDARSSISVTGNGSYNSTTGVITVNSAAARTFNNPTRTLNTAFQPSTTQDTLVTYTVDVTCTMSLTSGQSGTAVLEYADDSGFTTNVKTVCKPTNANSGALTIGLALTQISGVVLHGVIPVSKYVRIRTINNTGTPTFTLQNSQEVLF